MHKTPLPLLRYAQQHTRSPQEKKTCQKTALLVLLWLCLLLLTWQQSAHAAPSKGLHPYDVINLAGAYAQGYTGKGVTVGVIDTPIKLDHPAFDGHVTQHPPLDIYGSPPTITWDITPHGSHVAGLIAAQPFDGTMHGVAYDANIWSGIWDIPGYLLSKFFDGPGYFARPNVPIYNNSWATTYWHRDLNRSSDDMLKTTMSDAMSASIYKHAQETGALFVFAASNDGSLIASPEALLPRFAGLGNLPNWLSVGSLDSAGITYNSAGQMVLDTTAISTFSNFAKGAELWTVMAPGTNILSVDAMGGYRFMSGTSMAAPIVSGAAALVQQAYPWFTGKQIADAILTTANNDFQAPDYFISLDTSKFNTLVIRYIDKQAPTLSKEEVKALVTKHYEESKAAWENRKVTLEYLLGLIDDGAYKTEQVSREEVFGQGILDVGKAVQGIARLDANRMTAKDVTSLDELQQGRSDALETFDTKGYISEFSNDISQRQWDNNYHHPDYGTGGIKNEDALALFGKDVGLRKTGAGMLILSGTNSYEGATVVDDGILAIARHIDGTGGVLENSDVLVRTNGILMGDGEIKQQLVNNGTVIPGFVGDTLTVHDYTQNKEGTLVITFDEQQHNALHVDTAHLGGDLIFMPEEGHFYSNCFFLDINNIVQSQTGAITGAFDRFFATDNSPTLHTTLEDYDPSSFSGTVHLHRPTNAYSQYAANNAATSLGGALYGIASVAQGDMQHLLTALDWSHPDGRDVRRALNQLGADAYDAAARASLGQQQEFTLLLLRRMLGNEARRRTAAAATNYQDASADTWQAWAMPYGASAWQGSASNSAAWESAGVGLLAGMERHFDTGLSLGFHLAVAARRTTVKDDHDATIDTNTALFGLQGIFAPEQWHGAYLTAQARLGVEDGELHRSVSFQGYARSNESHWTGLVGSAAFGGGKDWTWSLDESSVTAGPLAWLDYSFVRRPDIFESHGQASRLHVDTTLYQSLVTSLGAHVGWQTAVNEANSVSVDLLAAWRHELLDGTFRTQAAFRGYDSHDFHSATDLIGRDALLVQGSLRLDNSKNVFAQLDAGGEFFKTKSTAVNVGLSIGWSF